MGQIKSIDSDKLINKTVESIVEGGFISTFKDNDPTYVCTWNSVLDEDIPFKGLIGMVLNFIVKDKSKIEYAVQSINAFSEALKLPKTPAVIFEVIEEGVIITFVQYVNHVSGEVLGASFGRTYEQKVYDVTD